MKTFGLAILMLASAAIRAHGQESKIIYHAKVTLMDGGRLDGYVAEYGDRLRLIAKSRPYEEHVVEPGDIGVLSIRRKGAGGKAVLIGASVGAAFGAVVGLASYSPPSCNGGFCIDFGPEGSALGGGVVGLLVGTAFGSITGSSYKKFEIQGSVERFREFGSEFQALEVKKKR